ncbi:MAG: hypothetical protein MZV65_12670 [Chromatiales bacterium]|nr:hypothetical protein [Chromatiales bacterium]
MPGAGRCSTGDDQVYPFHEPGACASGIEPAAGHGPQGAGAAGAQRQPPGRDPGRRSGRHPRNRRQAARPAAHRYRGAWPAPPSSATARWC